MKLCCLLLLVPITHGCDAIAGNIVALSSGDAVSEVVATATKLAPPDEKQGLRRFLDALRRVETGGHGSGIGIVGDGGRAFGPYQIHKGYWQDSRVPGSHADCLRDVEYSERVVIAYMKRYAPEALLSHDWQTLARIHNGGPKGASKKATLAYWKRVEKEMSR